LKSELKLEGDLFSLNDSDIPSKLSEVNSRPEKLGPLLVFGLLAALLMFPGCGKIKNPDAKEDERHSFLFFNYTIENPHAHPAQIITNGEQEFAGRTLKALLLTNYFPEKVFKEFARDTGAGFKLTLVSTPEEIIQRVTAGEKFDLTMGPGYLAQRFISEQRLHPLNHQNLSNIHHLERYFVTNVFDPHQNYAVPYLWSVAGLVYNSDHYQAPPSTWADLIDPPLARRAELAGKIAFLPGPYRALAAALVHLGKSPDTTNTNELVTAATLLLTNAQALHFQFASSDLAHKMITSEILIAQCYGYQAQMIDRLDAKMDFAVPTDGTWITYDFLFIPATAPPRQKALAEAFINYLLDPRVAGSVVHYSSHASVVEGARTFVPPEERRGPAYMHPDEHDGVLYVQTFDKGVTSLREELWAQLQKAADLSPNTNQPPSAPH
jgi:spermidine/putrescine transport system substrate-binding protein